MSDTLSNIIIKADKTRLLPPEKKTVRKTPSPDEGEAEREREAAQNASYQAAYDEVVEAAQQEVALILQDARRKAREMIEGAGAQAEKARETAREEGFQRGLGLGLAEGADRAEKALEDILREGQAEADRVVADAYTARDALLDEMEPKILSLALDVARKVIGYELERSDEAFVSLVTAALDVIKCESRVTLRVNAEQHAGAFRSKAEARLKTAQGVVEADVVSDMGIEPNGCLIENGRGTVDASVDVQLEQIARNLGFE